MNNNKITEIPDSIKNLGSLSRVYLNNNLIKKIPEAVMYLKNLRELELNNNQIREFPEYLKFAKVRRIELKKNLIKLDEIPPSLKIYYYDGIKEGIFSRVQPIRKIKKKQEEKEQNQNKSFDPTKYHTLDKWSEKKK